MLKKKFYFVFYLAAIIFILFFTLNGYKIYTIKEKNIENNNNKMTLEKEKLNNYSLDLKEDINYNKLYVYKLKNDKFYVFVYSKSIFFDRYNLDDNYMTGDKSIDTVASNFKYNNSLKIDLEKEPIKIDVKSEVNERTRNNLIKYLVIVVLIAFLGYRRDKKENSK